ncbi:hypothetical protein [Nocardia sp. NPDC051570]|uniref:hypothetical protein n=1 Tax=Nocardia sp. NPDC051570 TaxID=3364324 RepID=UPI0037AE3FA9
MLPINFAWASEISALQLDLLTLSLPRSIAAGAIIALIVAVFATTVNHALAAWGSALCGVAIMCVNHIAGRNSGPAASLSTLNFVDAIAAGILLGGLAAAVMHGRAQVFGWTLGALSSIVLGVAIHAPRGGTRTTDSGTTIYLPNVASSPPLWLLIVTLIAIAVGTFVNRRRTGIERRSVELPMAPILAGTLYVGVTLFGSEWLARHADNVVEVGMAVAMTVAAGLISAMLLPRRDGTLVLLAMALSAVGASIIPSRVPIWTAVPLVVVIGAGILLGFRRPAPFAALFALGALALLGAVTSSSADSTLRSTVFSLALAALAGYCFSSAAPRYNPTRVLGMAIVFVPSVVSSLRDQARQSGRGSITVEDGHWHFSPAPTPNSATPYWTALVITIGCVLGLIALRRWRAPAFRRRRTTTER